MNRYALSTHHYEQIEIIRVVATKQTLTPTRGRARRLFSHTQRGFLQLVGTADDEERDELLASLVSVACRGHTNCEVEWKEYDFGGRRLSGRSLNVVITGIGYLVTLAIANTDLAKPKASLLNS